MNTRTPLQILLPVLLASAVSLVGCSDEDLDSDDDARRAYIGFDPAVDLAIELGLQGFNAASSANIDDQTADGAVSGSLVVGGQVDQGNSDNKGMRLGVTAVDFSDGPVLDTETDDEVDVHYDTPADEPLSLEISMKNIPNGTFTGSMAGDMLLSGDIDAEASYALTLSGELETDPNNAENVTRKPGTLLITGTVTSGDGTYDVNVER